MRDEIALLVGGAVTMVVASLMPELWLAIPVGVLGITAMGCAFRMQTLRFRRSDERHKQLVRDIVEEARKEALRRRPNSG